MTNSSNGRRDPHGRADVHGEAASASTDQSSTPESDAIQFAKDYLALKVTIAKGDEVVKLCRALVALERQRTFIDECYVAVRVIAEGSDWKRGEESMAEWVTRRLRPSVAQSESGRSWLPYPAQKPEPNKDARHLVILVTGDMHWVGIRFYDHQRDCWSGRGNEGENGEQVWYFKPLLADGERLPPIPNAREQRDEPTDTPEIRWQRTTR